MFKQAPLPFTGQKRMFLRHFKAILDEQIPGDGEGWTIVDTFGGSGLLSHTAKQLKPRARVIYNDFDTIKAFDGYVDLATLTSWLLFSGQQVGTFEELCAKDFWHCLRQSDYPSADGCLDGVEVVSESFHTLLPRFTADSQAVFVLDPPYLCTKQESYKQAHYFDLIDFLRLVNITRPPYIFFSSTKSEFVRFIEYMQEDKVDNWQAFAGAQRVAIKTALNYQGLYEDNMVYKF